MGLYIFLLQKDLIILSRVLETVFDESVIEKVNRYKNMSFTRACFSFGHLTPNFYIKILPPESATSSTDSWEEFFLSYPKTWYLYRVVMRYLHF